MFAVQIAKSFGASVTGVCSTRNADLVRSIGADQVIDYTQQDFTKCGQRYDVVFDCVGNHSFSACRRVLNSKGIFVGVGAPADVPMWRLLAGLIRALVLSVFVSQKMTFFIARVNQRDLTTVRDLMATGKVTPVIDRHYWLSETREAFRYMEEGHARGKVIISPKPKRGLDPHQYRWSQPTGRYDLQPEAGAGRSRGAPTSLATGCTKARAAEIRFFGEMEFEEIAASIFSSQALRA
jgi:hypothetical protein